MMRKTEFNYEVGDMVQVTEPNGSYWLGNIYHQSNGKNWLRNIENSEVFSIENNKISSSIVMPLWVQLTDKYILKNVHKGENVTYEVVAIYYHKEDGYLVDVKWIGTLMDGAPKSIPLTELSKIIKF